MAVKFSCVRCGSIVCTDIEEFNIDKHCAPCCAECRGDVEREVRSILTFWPSDWVGQWWWSEIGSRWVTTHQHRETLVTQC